MTQFVDVNRMTYMDGINKNWSMTGFSGQTNPCPTLESCPFCGGEVEYHNLFKTYHDTVIPYRYILCKGCRLIITDSALMKSDNLIDLFNRRVNK